MMPFFGNGKEAMCVIPIVILGMTIIGISDSKVDKSNIEKGIE